MRYLVYHYSEFGYRYFYKNTYGEFVPTSFLDLPIITISRGSILNYGLNSLAETRINIRFAKFSGVSRRNLRIKEYSDVSIIT